MSTHETDGHAARLDALLAEAADPRRAFQESDLAACEACREIVRHQETMSNLLDRLGQEERDSIAAAMAEPAPSAGRAEAALRDRVLAPRPRGSSFLRFLPGIAAAAVVLVAWVLWPDGEVPFDPNTTLGGAELEMQPDGPTPDFSAFTWKHELSPGGWFKVYVYDEDDATDPIAESPRLDEPRWAPEPSVHRAWPDKIHWNLEIHRGSVVSDVPASYYRSAQRSR